MKLIHHQIHILAAKTNKYSMFRLIPLFLTLAIFVACSDSDTPDPQEEGPQGIVVGDESLLLSLPTDVTLGDQLQMINDTAQTDTLFIDIDADQDIDLQIIFIGKLPNADAERPVEEDLFINLVGDFMFEENEVNSTNNLFFPIQTNDDDLLTQSTSWFWYNQLYLIKRVRNTSVRINYEDPSWSMAMYQPSSGKAGWINFSIVYDDIYIDQFVINEIGLGTIPEEDN